ncbi:DegV family protein [Microbulbifer hainanensis]|uniref:DegV family protein n=1 Tax=Microbulbifer hainanensis TaxID=2735675 RepID=UPI0018687D35|nr:DegV family protein [Microbulbifer hainanensis]
MVQLVVDSGCDLPDEFLRKYAIPVLPHTVSVGKDTFGDQRNPAQMAHFYTLSLVDRSRQIVSGPAESGEIGAILQRLVARGSKDIVVQTINGSNSPTYQNAQTAASKLLAESSGDVEIHTVDSHTLFSGQGLLALYTLSLIQRGLSGAEIKDKAEDFGRRIQAFAAIKDVYYVRERGRLKNENSISWLKAMAAQTLDLHPILSMKYSGSSVTETVRGFDQCTETLFALAAERIRAGDLQVPMIAVSIAGRLEDLSRTPGFNALEKLAQEKGVKIYRSVMSLSGGINLGPGTIGMAFAARD